MATEPETKKFERNNNDPLDYLNYPLVEDSSASNAPITTPTTVTEETDDTTLRSSGVLGYASQGLKGATEFFLPGDDGIDVIDQVENFGKGVLPGAIDLVDQTVAGTLALVATDPGLKFLGANLSKKTEQKYRDKTREVLDLISEAKAFQPDIGEEGLFAEKLGKGLGSTLPILGAAAASRGKSLPPIVMGMLASGGEGSDRAIAEGATEDQRSRALKFATTLGITEALAPIRVANLFKKGFGDEAAEGIFESFKRIAETTGLEAAQEYAQGLGQNLIERGYNLDKELFGPELPEDLKVGGGVGFIIATMAELALPRKFKGKKNKDQEKKGAEEFYNETQKEEADATKENPSQRQLQTQVKKDIDALLEEEAEAEAKLVQQKEGADLAITEKNTADAKRIKESGLTEEDLRASGLDKRNTEYKKLELLDYTNPSDVGSAIEIYKGLLNNPKTATNPEAVAKINSIISTLEQTQEEPTLVKKREGKATSDVVEVKPAGISDRMNMVYQRGLQEKTLTYADVDGSLPPGFDSGLQGDFYALLESKGITLVDVGNIKSSSIKSKDASQKILKGRKEVALKDAGFDSNLNDVMFKTFEDHYNQSINVAESNISKGYITRNKINELINTVEETTADQKLALAQEAVRYFTSKGIEIEAESTESRDAEEKLEKLNKTETKRKRNLLGEEILGKENAGEELVFVTPEYKKSTERKKTFIQAFKLEANLASKNPLNKKVGQKTTIARLDNNQDVELLKGTTRDHPKFGRVLEIKDGSATSFVPLKKGVHIYKPTDDQLTTLGYQPKPKDNTKPLTSFTAAQKLGLKEQRRDGTETPEMQVLLEKLTAAEIERDSYNRQGEKVLPRVKRRVAAAQSAVTAQRKIEQEISPLEQQSEDLFSNTSVFEKGGSDLTTVNVVDALAKEYGNGIKQGIESGFINILNTAMEIPISILEDSYNPKTGLPGISGNTVAFINTRDNKVYIIADRLKSISEAPIVLRHEVGVHYGLRKMLGEETYNLLVESLKANKDTDPDIKSAWEGVSKTYADRKESDPIFIEEVIARIGDRSPQNSLWRRIVEAIKNFFRNLGYGWNVDNISAKEIQEMIRYSTKEAIKNSPVAGGATTTDILDISEARIDRDKKDLRRRAKKKIGPPLSVEKMRELKKAIDGLESGVIDKAINKIFEFDFALMSKVRSGAELNRPDSYRPVQAALADFTASQTLHYRSLTDNWAKEGNLTWLPNYGMYYTAPNSGQASLSGLFTLAEEYAAKAGITEQEAQRYAHLGFIARRMNEIRKNNNTAKKAAKDYKEIANKTPDVKEKNKLLFSYNKELKKIKLQHLTNEAITEGLSLYNTKGELGEFIRASTIQWEAIHADVIKHMVDSQLMSQEQAEEYMDATGYVPAQREGFEDQSTEWGRGLKIVRDGSKKKMTGSYRNIKNIYENIENWSKRSISNAIINRNRLNKINRTFEYAPEIIKEVTAPTGNMENRLELGVISVYMNFNGKIKEHYFQFTDPIFAAAFGGLDTILLPGMRLASRFTNASRNAIVLYPMFSITQIFTQDMVSAMFTSGTKYPFLIPLAVVKQLALSMIGKSKVRDRLKGFGSVGTKGSTIMADPTIGKRGDLEEFKGSLFGVKLAPLNTAINAVKKAAEKSGATYIYEALNLFAQLSDNAIRQATYELTFWEAKKEIKKIKGISKEEREILIEEAERDAVLRSFNIIHFLYKGSSPVVKTLIPITKFMNAGLRAVKVQGDVLALRGIAPRERAENASRLFNTLFKVAFMSVMYTLAKGDDEDYKNLDPAERDYKIHLFGNYTAPVRPDFFTFLGFIIPQHVVNMTMQQTQDSEKFKVAVARAIKKIMVGNYIPDVIKIALEMNFNETMGQLNYKISPDSLENQEPRNQFKASTFELAKLIGEISGYNPIKVQQFFMQTLSSIYTIVAVATEPLLADPGKPELTLYEKLRRLPSMKAFMMDPDGNTRNMNDLYELIEYTNEMADTYNFDLNYNRNREENTTFYKRYKAGIEANKTAKELARDLSEIRNYDKRIAFYPPEGMTQAEKLDRRMENRAKKKAILSRISEIKRKAQDDLASSDVD